MALYSIDTADRLIEEFNHKCRYLTKFPLMGKGYPDLLPYLRGIPFQKYIVFYRVINDGIEIMRIIKGDRNLEAVFSDE